MGGGGGSINPSYVPKVAPDGPFQHESRLFLHFVYLCTVAAQQCLFVCLFEASFFLIFIIVCFVNANRLNELKYQLCHFKVRQHHFLLASFVMVMSNYSLWVFQKVRGFLHAQSKGDMAEEREQYCYHITLGSLFNSSLI